MKSKVLPAIRLAGAVLVLAVASPAGAHHSAAAYDYVKTLSATGTIKTFRWSSPHCSVVIAMKDAAGKTTELSITSAAPVVYARQGFKADDFKPGQKVSISWHPGRSDPNIGVIVSMTLSDGRTFKE